MTKPFIAIGGCPRSGTTALTYLLNCDKRLFITAEYRILRCWNQRIGYQLLKSNLRKGKKTSDVFWKRGVNPGRILQNKLTTGQELYKFILSQQPGLSYVGDKLPRYHLYSADKIIKEFPNTKFLFCLRDGRAVIASQIRMFHEGKTNNTFVAKTIEEAEDLWLLACRSLRKHKVNHRLRGKFMVVRYEEAVQNPQVMVNKIGKFLGLGNLNISGHDYRPIHLNSWKTTHPRMMDKLSERFKDCLEEFGYL